jgi:hypothetical protein
MNFNATIEIINVRKAILTLTNTAGEWSGSYLIEGRSLYERGYNRASIEASFKGGSIETYREIA